jgi:hypothetical protein
VTTVGSISREEAAARFPFLAANFSGKRKAIKEFTHRNPDFVFWIYPTAGCTMPAPPMRTTHPAAMSTSSTMNRIMVAFYVAASPHWVERNSWWYIAAQKPWPSLAKI